MVATPVESEPVIPGGAKITSGETKQRTDATTSPEAMPCPPTNGSDKARGSHRERGLRRQGLALRKCPFLSRARASSSSAAPTHTRGPTIRSPVDIHPDLPKLWQSRIFLFFSFSLRGTYMPGKWQLGGHLLVPTSSDVSGGQSSDVLDLMGFKSLLHPAIWPCRPR